MPQHRKILLGFLAGAAAGLCLNAAFPEPPGLLTGLLDYVAEPLGQLFLRLLLMAVLPLVVSSLLLGVWEMGDSRTLGRVALKTLGFTLLVTSVSVLLGIAMTAAFQPGKSFPPGLREHILSQNPLPAPSDQVPARGPLDHLLRLIPDNPVQAAAGGDFLGVMFFSLLFGLGLLRADRATAEPLVRVLQGVFDASMAFIALVMRMAPLGVGALILNVTARFGFGLLQSLLGYAAVVLGALALHLFGTYSLLARFGAGVPPRRFFGRIREAMLTAFATSSSSATLPVALRVSEENLQVPRDISRFVLTVGASANQNGTALYEGVTVLFLAQCFGLDLTWGQQATVVGLAILGGVGTAGVPGGSLPMVMAILASVGLPPEGVLLILGIDRFLDMCRTVLNVSGDLLIALLVSRGERGR